MQKVLKIGTRESQLAVWQATLVKDQLSLHNIQCELVYIKSEGDIDLVTPLYEIGVQGIFTKTLDAALLNKRIDIAVHSMKDVPIQLAKGITQAAVLPRASYKDILVYKKDTDFLNDPSSNAVMATSSIRRKAQWLHRYKNHTIENLRGNVNTRLQKVKDNNWDGAIFAAAGLERINMRPENSIDLTWMLPAPAQGAIMVVCRETDNDIKDTCTLLNDEATALCTKLERDFLKALLGGCSTPISALATIENDIVSFKGNIYTPTGKTFIETSQNIEKENAACLGINAAKEILSKGAGEIIQSLRNAQT
ncbi:hydroxymethylbilane synthase [soil metagenome]